MKELLWLVLIIIGFFVAIFAIGILLQLCGFHSQKDFTDPLEKKVNDTSESTTWATYLFMAGLALLVLGGACKAAPIGVLGLILIAIAFFLNWGVALCWFMFSFLCGAAGGAGGGAALAVGGVIAFLCFWRK